MIVYILELRLCTTVQQSVDKVASAVTAARKSQQCSSCDNYKSIEIIELFKLMENMEILDSSMVRRSVTVR